MKKFIKFLILSLLLITTALTLVGCGGSKKLSKSQYDTSLQVGYASSTITITIIDSDIKPEKAQSLSVKIRYSDGIKASKTETFSVYLGDNLTGSIFIDDLVWEYKVKKVVAYEKAEPGDGRPSIFATILIAIAGWIVCFILIFIPRSLCDDMNAEISTGLSSIPYLVLVIYAYVNWGVIRGIILTVALLVYGFFLNKLANDIYEYYLDQFR